MILLGQAWGQEFCRSRHLGIKSSEDRVEQREGCSQRVRGLDIGNYYLPFSGRSNQGVGEFGNQ